MSEPTSEPLKLDLGQAHELEITLRGAGYDLTDIVKMTQNGKLCEAFRAVLRGHAKIETVIHIIDCDAAPFIPEGWVVESHKKGGQLTLEVSKISLYLSPNQQKKGKSIKGEKLKEELEDSLTLNANVLDYLFAHPELIPDSWKGMAVFFWGTVYRVSNGSRYVRYLYWDDVRWRWDYSSLVSDFVGKNPAAVSAS